MYVPHRYSPRKDKYERVEKTKKASKGRIKAARQRTNNLIRKLKG